MSRVYMRRTGDPPPALLARAAPRRAAELTAAGVPRRAKCVASVGRRGVVMQLPRLKVAQRGDRERISPGDAGAKLASIVRH